VPYSQKIWQGPFASQLASFVRAVDGGHRLKDLKILISSWHYFREMRDWQIAILVQGLGVLDVRGDVQVRGRGFEREVRERIREIGLGQMMRGGGGGRVCSREVPVASCGRAGEELDWEWAGGVVV
jgi:hypothetical protein